MMNQNDIILLGELLETLDDSYSNNKSFSDLIKKAKIVSEQARASKEYQELIDDLNNQLSDIGKEDVKNG